MIVAVIGGSHGGYATAGDLALGGHHVRLWRRSSEALAPLRTTGALTVEADGGARQARLERVTTDVAEAVDGAEVVIVPLPATAHVDVAGLLAPWLDERKVVLLTPGSLGTFVVAREIARPGGTLPFAFAETGTLPYLARRTGPTAVTIAARAVSLPTGVFPGFRTAETLARLTPLFPAIRGSRNVLDAALTNPGPVLHPPLVLLNAGAIDRGDFDLHADGMTVTVRHLVALTDAERVSARQGWSFPAPHYEQVGPGETSRDGEAFYGPGARARLEARGAWEALLSLDHRYVTEDVALGLALFESAARTVGVDTPATTGLLGVFGALLGRRLGGGGRALEHLGLGDLTRREIDALLHDGWASPMWSRVIR